MLTLMFVMDIKMMGMTKWNRTEGNSLRYVESDLFSACLWTISKYEITYDVRTCSRNSRYFKEI